MIPPIGSIGSVRTGGWMARLIRLATRSKVNHTVVYVGYQRVVSAEPRGARLALSTDYPQVSWLAPRNADIGALMSDHARRLIGTPYGFLDIVSVGLLQYHVRPSFLKRIVQREDRLICSQLADLCAERSHWQLFDDGRWPGDVTPGDIAALPFQVKE